MVYFLKNCDIIFYKYKMEAMILFFGFGKNNKSKEELDKAFEEEKEEIRKIVKDAAPRVSAAIREQRINEERRRRIKEEKAERKRIRKKSKRI